MHKHLITVNGDPDISPGHICPDISPPDNSPRTISHPFYTVQDITAATATMQSTSNVYKFDRGRSVRVTGP